MKILVACEESQIVCKAFRERGHIAFSCDIQECSGGHPEWHIKDDVLRYLNDGWDMMIAHPPCTFLSNAGNGYFNAEKYGNKAIERERENFSGCVFYEIMECINTVHLYRKSCGIYQFNYEAIANYSP